MCKEEKCRTKRSPKPDPAYIEISVKLDLQRAVLLHQSGQLQQAATIYKQVLDIDPENGDALHLLGLVSHQSGQSATAITLIKRALKISPNQHDFLCNLADILRESGQFKEAARVYQYVIQLQPESAEMYTVLGLTLKDAKQFEGAVQAYHQAIRINPVYDDVYSHLGNVLQEQDKLEESIQAYHQAIALNLEHADIYNNLGNALQKQDKLEESIQAYHQAIALNSEHAEAHNNLGNALQKQDKLEESIQAYHQAIEINPEYAQAFSNFGEVLRRQGEFQPAVRAYQKALETDPNYAEAHNNLGLVLLLTGDFESGWRECEWRWKCPAFPSRRPNFPQPLWKGQDIGEKTILVWGEQGVGDRIMYASLLPKLQQQAHRILVETQQRLVPLFRRSFSEISFFRIQDPPNSKLLEESIDYQLPIGSLARWLLPDEESFPKNTIYLKACVNKVKELRDKYQQLESGKLLIGVSWKSVNKDIGKLKSTFLTQWRDLLSQKDCLFINLQYGDVEEEINAFTAQTGISIYQDRDIDSLKDLDGFAAQVSALDLIISTSNTAVHMAGALGKPVWTLLHYVPDWRWQLDRLDTLWYPSMTLYRQPVSDDWHSVFQRVQADLQRFVTQNLDTKNIYDA